MSTADKLLDAHVRFELERLCMEPHEAAIQPLVDTLWEWAGEATVAAVVDEELAADAALRWVDDWYLPDSLAVLVGRIAKHLIRLPVNESTRLGDLVDDELYEAGVDLIVDLERLREAVIVGATGSPVYAMLISNILYSGIRDYATAQAGAAQKLPGAGLLSKGASALNKRMGGLEGVMEERLRGFINDNAQKSIDRSQRFLLETLTEERIRELASELWDGSRDTQLTVSDLVEDEEIDQIVSFGLAILQDLRQNEYIQELIREGIAAFYASHGQDTVQTLIQQLGLDQDALSREALKLAPPLLEAARDNGLLEAWIRARLEPFYASADCADILAV